MFVVGRFAVVQELRQLRHLVPKLHTSFPQTRQSLLTHTSPCSKLQNCLWSNESKNSGGIETNLQIETFLKEEPDFIKRFNSDFAQPYTDVYELLQSPSQVVNTTGSPLLDLNANTVIEKPGFDINHIIANIDKVERNAKIRNAAVNLDFKKDILELHKRLKLLDKEIEKYVQWNKKVKEQLNENDQEDLSSENTNKNIIYGNCILTILSAVKHKVEQMFYLNLLQLPNETHDEVPKSKNETDAKVLEVVGEKKTFEHEVFDHIYIAEKLQILRQRDIDSYTGPRNYYLTGAGAELEQALVQFTLSKLQSKNFTLMTTPNIIRDGVLEGAGVEARKMNEMVYSVEGSEKKMCLAGSSEIGLCAYFANQCIHHKYLPLKLCCVSTCYRKETGSRLDPKGLFRVHQFLKVEMFGVTANETGTESQELHDEFVSIQKELYQDLGLHFNVVDMPTGDLGLPAYRKIDIEAWFPGRNKYDEISSASNCTDFQSSRLQMMYEKDKKFKYVHTVNATACAAQRLIIALLENGQQVNKTVALPDGVVPFMHGKKVIKLDKRWTMRYIGPKLSKRNRVTPAEIIYRSNK